MSSDRATGGPILIVVSAPSGAGKTTLCDRLLRDRKDLVYSISCTTRAPRGSEVDGRDYYFLSEPEFDARLAAGRFLEHAVVHGHRYGTMRQTVVDALARGAGVLMDIDVQGADQIRSSVNEAPAGDMLRRAFVDIFILPPSISALKERLERRNEDRPDVIAGRLNAARRELAAAEKYMYSIVNDDIDRAYGELAGIVEREIALRTEAGVSER